MLAKIETCSVVGLTAVPITVEVDVSDGLPGLTLVGLPDAAVRESRERIRAAVKNTRHAWPLCRVTVNLAPAHVRKEGSRFDFPIALGLLVASGQLEPELLSNTVAIGELALDGTLRPVSGVLAVALKLKGSGKRLLLPEDNADEAAMIEGLDVYPLSHLQRALRFLKGAEAVRPRRLCLSDLLRSRPAAELPDFCDVQGQAAAKRAVEVAVAGGHNLILIGPPGTGKTLLAERIPSILPELSPEESLETTLIHSVAGLLSPERPLQNLRPFRSPHHSISDVGLVGGGSIPKPGELSLAHHGVLFLDELPEFNRSALEALRQPLEEGIVTITRAWGTVTFPARCMVVAAMNPCPCGFAGNPLKHCLCTPSQFLRYRCRLSGPLLDRMDLHVEVPAVPLRALTEEREGEPSSAVRGRVVAARKRQAARFRSEPGIRTNAQMRPAQIKRYCALCEESRALARRAIERLGLSARAYHRILKVSRTIADLADSETVGAEHVAEAVQYRSLDRTYSEVF